MVLRTFTGLVPSATMPSPLRTKVLFTSSTALLPRRSTPVPRSRTMLRANLRPTAPPSARKPVQPEAPASVTRESELLATPSAVTRVAAVPAGGSMIVVSAPEPTTCTPETR